MLPQYLALSVSFVCVCVQKYLCVCSMGYIFRASPTSENMCARLLGYIVGASPLCVSVQLVTLWVRSPLVCVLSFDTCMLPTRLCGIFSHDIPQSKIFESQRLSHSIFFWDPGHFLASQLCNQIFLLPPKMFIKRSHTFLYIFSFFSVVNF